MHKNNLISLLLMLAIALSGCSQLIPPRTTLPVETTTAPSEPSAATEASASAETPTTPSIDRTNMLESYQFALQQFAFEHIWPDGTDLEFESNFGFIEENSFCIADVDSDGTEELVILYSTAPMAGMQARIFGFDDGHLVEELCAFPALEFYSHGLLKVFASHNHSMHMDFWPYSLLQYNPASHSYDLIASVSGWQKAHFPEDYQGNAFPEDIANGQDEVYLLSREGKEEILSPAQFADWEAENLGSETALIFDTIPTSEENIKAVVQP